MLEDELRALVDLRWRHRRNRPVVAQIDRTLVLMTQLLEARAAGLTGIEADVERLKRNLERAISASQTPE